MTPKFSLQNVLDVRHSRVESLEIALGRLMASLAEAQDRLVSLEQYQAALMDALTAMMQGEVDLFTVSHLQQNSLEAGKMIVEAGKEIERMNLLVEEKRRELVAAKQAEEALGILKNKMIEAYNNEQAQKEAHMQDEIYIARAFRGQMQGA